MIVFSAKVNELSAMINCNHRPKRDLLNRKLQNLATGESCFRCSNHRDERNNMFILETYKLPVNNKKKRSYNQSKSRFKRSRSDFSVKTCSIYQLKDCLS